jgi:DNA-binding CsgD family transcriptional regulator
MVEPAAYVAYDAQDAPLYAGATRNFHQRQQLHRKVKPEWLPLVVRWEVRPQPTWAAACVLEAKLIQELRPRYNRRGGFRSRPGPHPYREAQLARIAALAEQIIQLRRQGKTEWEIMRELHISQATAHIHIQRLLAEGRIERRRPGPLKGRRPDVRVRRRQRNGTGGERA